MEQPDCGTLLKKIEIALEKKVNEYLKELDITISQWKCIHYIHENGGKNVHLKEIQKYFGVSKPTMTGIVKRLEEKGLVFSEKADYSANSKNVSLTSEGKKLCAKGLRKKKIVDDLPEKFLTSEELASFTSLLGKVYDGIAG